MFGYTPDEYGTSAKELCPDCCKKGHCVDYVKRVRDLRGKGYTSYEVSKRDTNWVLFIKWQRYSLAVLAGSVLSTDVSLDCMLFNHGSGLSMNWACLL